MNPKTRRRAGGADGFTLVELGVVLAVVVTLAMLAIPNPRATQVDAQARAWTESLHAGVQRARVRALREGEAVTVCALNPAGDGCADDGASWHRGWLIHQRPADASGCLQATDDPDVCQKHGGRIYERHEALHSGLTVATNQNVRHRIRIDALGRSPGSAGRLTVCDGPRAQRGVVVASSGRTRDADPDEALECPA